MATLYPGVTSLDAARKLEVGPDSDINGIDFSIARSRLVKVGGHVLNAITGTPSRVASVNLTGGLFGSFRTLVDENGSFQFLNVPVGEYVVWASEENSGPDRAFSTKRIMVTENGLNDLELIFKPPVPVSGRVILEDGGAFQNPVMVPGITFNLIEGTLGTGTTALMDGSFQLGRLKGTGLVDGEYRVSVDHLPGDYYVKSMSFGSSDLLRENLKIAGPPAAQIAITLARGTSVAGNVLDDNHLAARNVLVYLIPRTATEAASYLARKAQTNQDGGFVIHGVAPGDYTIFAISSPFAGLEQDPEFTKDYETRGMPITASREPHPPLTLPLLR